MISRHLRIWCPGLDLQFCIPHRMVKKAVTWLELSLPAHVISRQKEVLIKSISAKQALINWLLMWIMYLDHMFS
jgi:hypothetical protein